MSGEKLNESIFYREENYAAPTPSDGRCLAAVVKAARRRHRVRDHVATTKTETGKGKRKSDEEPTTEIRRVETGEKERERERERELNEKSRGWRSPR